MKLNLGCGDTKPKGWVNVDKYASFSPDLVHDLEVIPWPFEESSCDEISLIHVLEHLGQDSDTFIAIMQELYRIAKAGAKIQVNVPHPRHDDFLNDPTHVRPITPDLLSLFDLDLNRKWQEKGAANSRLAMASETDFRITDARAIPDPRYLGANGKPTVGIEELLNIARVEMNAIKEFRITMVARK